MDNLLSLEIAFPKGQSLKLVVHPNATIQDIKVSISDSSDSQSYTCFDLFYNGALCDPKMELTGVKEVNAVLTLVPKPYNEHEIRVHLSRFREIMTSFKTPSQMYGYEASRTLYPEIKESESLSFQSFDRNNIRISNLFDKTKESMESILESIEISGWNPPTFSRKIRGDLIYLKVSTLESHIYQITGSSRGFYINGSTAAEFSPDCIGDIADTLPELLTRISPLFGEKYPLLQTGLLKREPYEFLIAPYPVYPWLVPEKVLEYGFDHGRTLDSLLMASDVLDTLACRDWNEELQSARELPKSSVHECVSRDQAISKAHSDFVEAAVRGALGIVHGSVPPMEASNSVFIHNNMFFSQIDDHLEHFEKYGGLEAAHAGLSKDIDGIKLVSAAESSGICTISGAVVDYKGVRTVAQTLVPGLIRKNTSGQTSVLYGASDLDKNVSVDEEFNDGLKAMNLNLQEHAVNHIGNGSKRSILTSLDSKGVLGSDSRKYLLDLYRMTPVDICFKENSSKDTLEPYPHDLVLIRPELIDVYKNTKYAEILRKKHLKSEGKAENQEESKSEHEELSPITFNVDAFTPNAADESGQEKIRELSGFLNDVIIEMANMPTSIPVDGAHLTRTLHNNGVNMRYLGKIAQLVGESEHSSLDVLKWICEEEMIARACKHILRKLMAPVPVNLIPVCISHFLNCLFFGCSKEVLKHLEALSLKDRSLYEFENLNETTLLDQIISQVKQRFRYVVKKDRISSCGLPLLRSICLKVGIQLLAKDYDFSSEIVFSSSDIVNIYPIVKHSEPHMNLADQIFQHGAELLRRAGQPESADKDTETSEASESTIKQGIELMKEAISILELVRGPIHPHTARALSQLALYLSKAQNLDDAIFFQKKSLIAFERCFGLDDPGTIQQYSNLAQLEFSSGKKIFGIELAYRALCLELVLNSNCAHLDIAVQMTNIGTMCHKIPDISLGNEFLSQALIQVESLFGPDHPMTISSVENLIRGLYLNSEYRVALKLAKRVLIVNEKRFGDNDSRSIESKNILHNLTFKAVEQVFF